MKFSINQQNLNGLLSIVNKAVANRTTVPALAGVYIEAQENEVVFRTTNLELSIQANAPALIEEDGTALLPAKLLMDIVAALPDEAVSIEANQEKAEISCAKSNFNIRVLNAVDYPQFPQVEATQKVDLPFSQFSFMTKKVARMVARDDTRPVLQGVNVNVKGKTLELVATDAYRIAVAKAEIKTDNESEFAAVIPGAFLLDVAGLKGEIENATISLSENQVVVECNDVVFINRRIAGKFPPYQQLIPQDSSIKATINTKALMDAVKRISVINYYNPIIKFVFDPVNGIVCLSGNAQDVGTCEESLECKYLEGTKEEKLEIAFNCNYVIDGLNCIDSESTKVEFVADSKPGIFSEDNSSALTYILLPVKIN